ncbi:MAG: TIGR04283 family arsenosugar biosynthesis glycosyltransferase [Cellvibrionaceae bacterium]
MNISIIIPVLNEAAGIEIQLKKLRELISDECEIIVVDGSSHDKTVALAKPLSDKVIVSDKKGRAIQMNIGAAAASGNTLLFLHSDTILPDNFFDFIYPLKEKYWGFFRVKLSGQQWQFRIIETMMNIRSKLTSIATGDQCLFVQRQFFTGIKGFDDLPLMEDIAFCKRIRKYSSPLIVNNVVVTSSRRWEKHGILKTILLMWRLRLEYFLGVSPERLVKRYYSNV